MPTIAEQVVGLNAALAEHLPAEANAIFGADIARFAATPVPTTVATVGQQLPNVTVLDAEGATTSFYDLLTHDQTVVVVYRGSWCPYCNLTLRAYEHDLVPALAEHNVGFVALTIQKPEGLETMVSSNQLSFTAYSDHTGGLIDALGVWTTPADDAAATQAAFGLGVPEGNVDGTTRMPMPTTLVVSRDGTITFIDVHPDFTTRTEVSEILGALA